MINTVNIKQQQLQNTYFTTGSGEKVVLIIGSCRVCPIVNYFIEYNEANGDKFTIHTLDPFNLNWNEKDDRVDYTEALLKVEKDERLLSMLKTVDVFIHEHYQNAEMFNCNKSAPKNLYQFGLQPMIDICLPNFNNLFILVGDIVSNDVEIRKKAIEDYNVVGKLTEQTERDIKNISNRNIQKFYDVCNKSDIPEMAYYFLWHYTKERLFWTSNHVSKNFTLAILDFMNKKYLHLDLSNLNREHEDMFANNFTSLTEYDFKISGIEWNEEIKPLKDKL